MNRAKPLLDRGSGVHAAADKIGLSVAGAAMATMLWPMTGYAADLSQDTPSAAGQIWPALLALLAIAFVLERVLELLWNYLEWLLINFAGWAPARLRAAAYVHFKGGTSLLLAAVLAIFIANTTALRIFAQFQPLAPSLLAGISDAWDVLMTGLLIGASTKLIHDLVGVLNHGKRFLANNADKQQELAAAALADGVLKLAESEAQAMIDVPGVGPTRLSSPGNEDEKAADSGTTDAYIDTLRAHMQR